MTDVEREDARQHQEDHQEHVRHRRHEVTAQFSAHDRYGRVHGCASVFSSSPRVIWRNTSSSRPRSSWISEISSPC
ncbi:hypothetical protein [Dyella humi]|uniref:hypothetical protein n=1 Tax=Dyella humi TaxID=1770547 RepID=UPI0038502F16